MTRMKDSGIEWIGEVPEEWEICRIKDIYSFFTGTTPDTGKTEFYGDENGSTWITISDMQEKYVSSSKQTLSELFITSKLPMQSPRDSLLYSFKLSVGKVSFAQQDLYTNEAIATFLATDKVCLRFLYYSSFLIEFNAEVNIYGAKILNRQRINNAILINPPLLEQTQIADFLDKKVAQLDEVKSLLEEQIKTLEDYRRSLIYETVTKGLDKTVPLKDSGVDWIGQIPEGWEVKKHKYIMSKTKTLCSHYSGQKILSLTRQGVISRDVESGKGKMPASFDGYQFLTRGDLLLCLFDIDVTPRCVGVVESDGLTSPAYSRFKVSEDSSVYYYYYLFLSMDDDKVLLHLAKNLRNSLTEDDFGDIETIVPSYKEQVIIANYLNKKTLLIDKLIKLKKEQIENINKQRQTLIYDYVTGKRRV